MPLYNAPLLIGGPFNLSKIPGMFAYWNAENAALSGTSIVTLADQSGAGQSARNLVRVANPGPEYNASDPNFNYYPSIYGTAATGPRMQALTFDTPIAQPYTVYLVHRIETNANTVFWRSLNGNYDNSAGYYMSGGFARLQTANSSGNTIVSSGAIANGNKVMCAVYNGMTANSAMYYNDSTNASGAYPAQGGIDVANCNGLTIGSFFSAVTYSWAAMVIYTGAHDQPTRAKVMSFFGNKYGIAVV